MIERTQKKYGNFSAPYLQSKGKFTGYSHQTLSSDEPDEEKFASADQAEEVRNLNSELKGAKAELVQMSDELRRMRANESSLTAENQILKSKLMHSDPSLANEVVEMSPTKSIPKLSGPPSANRTNAQENVDQYYDNNNYGSSQQYYDNN